MTTTRLPGITFVVEPPPATDPLPRMDIAAFVGFAASGPLDTPVAIEEPERFQELFGDAPRLAWDAALGAWQRACLAGAVSDFFAQGGRRCWVVRVAGDRAVANTFPLAGMLSAHPDGYVPTFVRARSAGSWSDDLRAGASILLQPVRFRGAPGEALERVALELGGVGEAPLRAGDLVRLDFDGTARPQAFQRIDRALPPDQEELQQVEGTAYWFHHASGAAFDGSAQNLTSQSAAVAGRLDPGALLLEGIDPAAPAAPGDWFTFTPDGAGARFWLLVRQRSAGAIELAGAWGEGAGAEPIGAPARAIRLTLTLAARRGEQVPQQLSDLSYAREHPLFAGYLPDDEALFALRWGMPEPPDGRPGAAVEALARAPRFPLAGPPDEAPLWIPLGLAGEPVAWRGPLQSGRSPLDRDGLVPEGIDPFVLEPGDWAAFVERMFLDPALAGVGEAALLEEAFDLRFVRGRRLRGIHSLLPLEEVSLLALPDAAQHGWRLTTAMPAPAPAPPPDPPAPEVCPGHLLFVPKDPPALPPPDPPAPAAALAPEQRWELLADHDSAGLLAVQQAVVRLAAARADLVAILSLPQSYRARAVLQHRRDLGRRLIGVRDLGSYAVFYHPWVIKRDPGGALRQHSPDGAVCGVIAARSIARGAWVAPANQPVRGAVALSRGFTRDEQAQMYTAGVNLVAPDPRGFVVVSAETLSDSADLRPLGVRRLLIVLRRLALREGQTYVFEPHSPAFRRRVVAGFERELAGMFRRGAFAGRNPAQAYRVVTDETINTPESIRAGRFIIELRVAPAQPLAFLVVRLIHSGPGALAVQEV